MEKLNQRVIDNYETMLDKFDNQRSLINANYLKINKIDEQNKFMMERINDIYFKLNEKIDSKISDEIKHYFQDNDINDIKEDVIEDMTSSIQEQADEIIKSIEEKSPSRNTFIHSLKENTQKLIIDERNKLMNETRTIIESERNNLNYMTLVNFVIFIIISCVMIISFFKI